MFRLPGVLASRVRQVFYICFNAEGLLCVVSLTANINSIERFITLLKKSSSGAVFNPWWEVDRQNDIARTAPIIRRRQLRAYLQQRLGRAKIVIIGEALGY